MNSATEFRQYCNELPKHLTLSNPLLAENLPYLINMSNSFLNTGFLSPPQGPFTDHFLSVTPSITHALLKLNPQQCGSLLRQICDLLTALSQVGIVLATRPMRAAGFQIITGLLDGGSPMRSSPAFQQVIGNLTNPQHFDFLFGRGIDLFGFNLFVLLIQAGIPDRFPPPEVSNALRRYGGQLAAFFQSFDPTQQWDEKLLNEKVFRGFWAVVAFGFAPDLVPLITGFLTRLESFLSWGMPESIQTLGVTLFAGFFRSLKTFSAVAKTGLTEILEQRFSTEGFFQYLLDPRGSLQILSQLAAAYEVRLARSGMLHLLKQSRGLDDDRRTILNSIISNCFGVIDPDSQRALMQEVCVQNPIYSDLVLVQKFLSKLPDSLRDVISTAIDYLTAQISRFGLMAFGVLIGQDSHEQVKYELLLRLIQWSCHPEQRLSWRSLMEDIWNESKPIPVITNEIISVLLQVGTPSAKDAFLFAFPRSSVLLTSVNLMTLWPVLLAERAFLKQFVKALQIRIPSGLDQSVLQFLQTSYETFTFREINSDFVSLLNAFIAIEAKLLGFVDDKPGNIWPFQSLRVPSFHAVSRATHPQCF
jgi:hypothetical protein